MQEQTTNGGSNPDQGTDSLDENSFMGKGNYPYGYSYSYGQSAVSEAGSTFELYFFVIARYKWLIALLTILVFAGTAAFTFSLPRKYTAYSKVKIGSYVPPEEGPMSSFLKKETLKDSYFTTQLALIKSHMVAKEVLKKNPDIRNFLYSVPGPNSPQNSTVIRNKHGDVVVTDYDLEHLEAYSGLISYKQLGKSSIAEIAASTVDPEMSAKVANAHAEAFANVVQGVLTAAAGDNLEYLQKQLDEAKQEVKQRERRFSEFVENNDFRFAASSKQGDGSGKALTALTNELSDAVLTRAATEAELRELKTTGRRRIQAQDPEARSAYLQTIALEDKYKEMSRYIRNKRHPILQKINSDIRNLREQMRLTHEEKVLRSEIDLKARRAKERLLRDELESRKTEEKKMSTSMARYTILKAELESARERYSTLQNRYSETQANVDNEQRTVQMIDTAAAPSYPTSPNRRFNLVLGLIVGLSFSIGVALLLDFFNSSVQSAGELQQVTGLPLLGIVPSFGHMGAKKRSGEPLTSNLELDIGGLEWDLSDSLISVLNPTCSGAERFRHLRSMLSYAKQDQVQKKFLITSGKKGDGKSTVAANLAASFAETGQRTILIDGDLRLPTLHDYFGLTNERLGLSNFLNGECEVADAVLETPIKNLSFMPSGTLRRPLSELAQSSDLQQLIEELASRYDRVIIDSPPIVHVSDSLTLSQAVDGVVIVGRNGKTPRVAARTAVTELQQIAAPLLGVVFNDVSRKSASKRSDYYYYEEQAYY